MKEKKTTTTMTTKKNYDDEGNDSNNSKKWKHNHNIHMFPEQIFLLTSFLLAKLISDKRHF